MNWRAWVLAAVVLTSSPGALAAKDPVTEPSVNIRFNPLGLALLGALDGGLDFAVGDQLTLGPVGSYIHYSNSVYGINGASLGARANIYLTGRRISDGWFLGPYLTYIPNLSVSENLGSSTITGDISGILSVGTLMGYQWVWPNGFNVDLAFGLVYYSELGGLRVTSSDGSASTFDSLPAFHGAGIASEFNLGWAF